MNNDIESIPVPVQGSSNDEITTQGKEICEICIDSNVQVACDNCGIKCCIDCNKRYILSSNSLAKCLKCKEPFTREFMKKNFPDFIQEYRTFEEKFYLEKESLLLDNTRVLVGEQVRIEGLQNVLFDIQECNKMESEKLNNFNKDTSDIKETMEIDYEMKVNHLVSYNEKPENLEIWEIYKKTNSYILKADIIVNNKTLFSYIDTINQEWATCQEQIKTIDDERQGLYIKLKESLNESKGNEQEIIDEITRIQESLEDKTKKKHEKCPNVDCSGLLIYHNQCHTCYSNVCSKCKEIISDQTGHECNKSTLKTLALTKKDSKHCPNCNVLIHKMSGCDDMFCVHCGKSFDWESLNITNRDGRNHHNYQVFQRNKVESQELILNPRFINNFHTTFSTRDPELMNKLRDTLLIKDKLLKEYSTDQESLAKLLYKERVRYVQDSITLKEWSKRIYEIKVNEREFYDRVYNVLNTYLKGMTVIFDDCIRSYTGRRQAYNRGTFKIIELDEKLKKDFIDLHVHYQKTMIDDAFIILDMKEFSD
jgi:hypothetical protein